MGIWGGRRPSRAGVSVVLAGLCVVAVAFGGGALTGQRLTASDTRAKRGGRENASAKLAPQQRVFVYGDSLAVQSEPYFAAVAKALDLKVTVRAFGGIAPCDALGWLQKDVQHSRPQIVVFAFSGNSQSECMRDTSGQLLLGASLLSKYRTDIETAIATAAHARVPFVLASPPAIENRRDTWKQLDLLYRDIAAQHPDIQYTDAGAQIAPDGQYAPTQRCLPFELNLPQSKQLCNSAGGSIGVRAADGVHFCNDPSSPATIASSCSQYSSGALRYAIALVSSAKLDLDFLATLPPRSDPTPS
jgi:hypothetical protein